MPAEHKVDVVRRVIGVVLALSSLPLFVLSANDIAYSRKSDSQLAFERFNNLDMARERISRSLDALALSRGEIPSPGVPKAAPLSQQEALRIGVFEGTAGLLLLLVGVMVFRGRTRAAASAPPA